MAHLIHMIHLQGQPGIPSTTASTDRWGNIPRRSTYYNMQTHPTGNRHLNNALPSELAEPPWHTAHLLPTAPTAELQRGRIKLVWVRTKPHQSSMPLPTHQDQLTLEQRRKEAPPPK